MSTKIDVFSIFINYIGDTPTWRVRWKVIDHN